MVVRGGVVKARLPLLLASHSVLFYFDISNIGLNSAAQLLLAGETSVIRRGVCTLHSIDKMHVLFRAPEGLVFIFLPYLYGL